MVGGGKRTLDDFYPTKKARDARWEVVHSKIESFKVNFNFKRFKINI